MVLCLVVQDQLQDRLSQGAAHDVPATLAVLPRLLREWGLLHPYVHMAQPTVGFGTEKRGVWNSCRGIKDVLGSTHLRVGFQGSQLVLMAGGIVGTEYFRVFRECASQVRREKLAEVIGEGVNEVP